MSKNNKPLGRLVNCTVCTYKSSGGGSKNKNALDPTHKNILHATDTGYK